MALERLGLTRMGEQLAVPVSKLWLVLRDQDEKDLKISDVHLCARFDNLQSLNIYST
jgi:hypothetical protein